MLRPTSSANSLIPSRSCSSSIGFILKASTK
jgi:hypothetical protein